MTSDTIMQKYLYNVPLLDNGLPMFKNDQLLNQESSIRIPLSFLQKKDVDDFKQYMLNIKKIDIKNITLYNDINLISSNKILCNVIDYYLYVFAYWFKKNGFLVNIEEKDSE
jgi:hypothetical protein